MKKTMLALTLSLLSAHAMAGFTKQGDLEDLAQNPSDAELQHSIRSAMLSSPKAPRAWLTAWSEAESQQEYGSRWAEVGLNLLRWSQPDKTYEWKAAAMVQPGNTLAYQQDSLIDLERAQAYHLRYPETSGTVHAVAMADTSKGQYQVIATSQRRMAMGLAPVGPDNADVQLCKLGRSSTAPYIEMSETQKRVFTETTGLDFSLCLSGYSAQAYWQQRFKDFVRDDYTHTDNLNPGTSW